MWHSYLPAPASPAPLCHLEDFIGSQLSPWLCIFKTLCKPPTSCQSLHALTQCFERYISLATPLFWVFSYFPGYYGKRWQRIGKGCGLLLYPKLHLKACKHARAFCIITHLYVLSFAISFISLVLNDIIQTSWAQAFRTCSTINKQKRLNTICNMSFQTTARMLHK